MSDSTEMRLDELARQAGVASTTVRLYQNKGLLSPPRLVGRTGWYDGSHLARLRLIARLQEQGFSLAGIARLLATWDEGRGLADIVGAEAGLHALFDQHREVVLDAADLLARFPAGALGPADIQRAAALGLVVAAPGGRFRVPDERFLEAGAALAALGVPAAAILDEWEHLAGLTDEMAERFIALFEAHLLPRGWRDALDDGTVAELTATLSQLHRLAGQVVAAALDASLARRGGRRLAGSE